MQVNKKELENSQVEFTLEFTVEEVSENLAKAAEKISEGLKIEGFRPGKAPLEIVKQKVGEMSLWEEAARMLIGKKIDGVLNEQLVGKQTVGGPRVDITKLAPNNPVECKVVISVLPDVALGKYKELGVKLVEAKIDEKELEKTIKDLAEMRTKEFLADAGHKAELGDKVLLDIEIFLDKVPVEGGASKSVAVILGKDYLVPGFDDQIKGIEKGGEREFALHYPENHHQKNLAGKLVDFKIKTQEIYRREVPEANDEFATGFNFKSLEEMREAISKNIVSETEYKNGQKAELEMLEKIVDDAKIGNLPETLIDHEAEGMMEEMKHGLEHQGLNFSDYLQHTGKTENEIMLELLPGAVKRVKIAMILREVSVIEKVEATESEIDAKIADLKEHYSKDAEALKTVETPSYRRYLRNAIVHEKTLNLLKEWNIKK
ncbi:MAG: trigger factor [Candidatus Falkowbacteria bacterium]|nr:trigger factor [Candidatus Falkowbacteria bacterium]